MTDDDQALPPTSDEEQRMERQLALLPSFSGAIGEDVAALGGLVVRLPGRGPGYNFAACVRWDEADVDRRVDALRRWFLDAGEWPALVVSEGLTRPVGLAQRLASLGWVELERERVYVTRQQPTVPHLVSSLRIEAVTPQTAAECQAIEEQVFGLAAQHSSSREEHLAQAVGSGTLRGYLVRLDGEAVASARLSIEDGLAAISGVGVMPHQRNKGFATLVTSIATRAGLAMGSTLVWLSVDERNEAALKVYRRLGYVPSFAWSRWAAAAR